MTEPTDKVDEQQLDEYLKGDSSVSRQYRSCQVRMSRRRSIVWCFVRRKMQ